MNEERCKRLEERQAALEQRVGAAINVAIATLRDEIGVEDALDHLAALRSPGVATASESDRCRQAAQRLVEIVGADGPMSLEDVIEWAGGKVDAAEFALATARRERDEAVAIVRDWLVWRSVHHVSDVHFPDLASVLSRARALVAAEEGPGPNAAGIAAALSTWQAERLANEALAGGPPPHDCGDGLVNDEPGATTWRGLVDAKEAEIADLRERCAFREQERDEARARIAALKAERTKLLKEQHAEEQKLRARIAELEAREVAANHRALGLQYELDTVVAALQERDRESRWIIEHIPMMQGSPTFEARVAEYLSATPPADPARGLVDAKEAEIAGLKAKLAEAERAVDETLKERDDLHDLLDDLHDLLDEFAACVASEDVIGEHTNANNPWRNAMAMVDTLRARIAELEARDREGRWLVERSNHRQVGKSASDKQRAEMDDYSRRADAYLSGTPPADPARGLIERAVAAMIVLAPQSPLIAHLRAYLGGE